MTPSNPKKDPKKDPKKEKEKPICSRCGGRIIYSNEGKKIGEDGLCDTCHKAVAMALR